MAHFRNTGYAVVDSDPNGIETLQENHLIKLAISNDGLNSWKFVSENEAGNKWVAQEIKVDDAFYVDENGVLRPNTKDVEEEFFYDGSTTIFECMFNPISIYNVKVRGIQIRSLDHDFKGNKLIEILYDLVDGDIISIEYEYFINAPI